MVSQCIDQQTISLNPTHIDDRWVKSSLHLYYEENATSIRGQPFEWMYFLISKMSIFHSNVLCYFPVFSIPKGCPISRGTNTCEQSFTCEG